MESAIPKQEHARRVLAAVGAEHPEADLAAISTGLAVFDFALTTVAAVEAHFSRYSLSQGRFAVLMLIFHADDPPWTPARIAEAIGATRATVTGLLDVLQEGGWIERRANPNDGRSSLVVLTSNGRRRLKRILPDHVRRIQPLLATLSGAERKSLLGLLAKLKPAFESLRQDRGR